MIFGSVYVMSRVGESYAVVGMQMEFDAAVGNVFCHCQENLNEVDQKYLMLSDVPTSELVCR